MLKINLRTYNEIVKRSIKLAKSTYYQHSFQKHKNDIKSNCRIIKDILNSIKQKNNYPETFWINGELISDKVVLADQLNLYFVVVVVVVVVVVIIVIIIIITISNSSICNGTIFIISISVTKCLSLEAVILPCLNVLPLSQCGFLLPDLFLLQMVDWTGLSTMRHTIQFVASNHCLPDIIDMFICMQLTIWSQLGNCCWTLSCWITRAVLRLIWPVDGVVQN